MIWLFCSYLPFNLWKYLDLEVLKVIYENWGIILPGLRGITLSLLFRLILQADWDLNFFKESLTTPADPENNENIVQDSLINKADRNTDEIPQLRVRYVGAHVTNYLNPEVEESPLNGPLQKTNFLRNLRDNMNGIRFQDHNFPGEVVERGIYTQTSERFGSVITVTGARSQSIFVVNEWALQYTKVDMPTSTGGLPTIRTFNYSNLNDLEEHECKILPTLSPPLYTDVESLTEVQKQLHWEIHECQRRSVTNSSIVQYIDTKKVFKDPVQTEVLRHINRDISNCNNTSVRNTDMLAASFSRNRS